MVSASFSCFSQVVKSLCLSKVHYQKDKSGFLRRFFPRLLRTQGYVSRNYGDGLSYVNLCRTGCCLIGTEVMSLYVENATAFSDISVTIHM